ncbi:hypothetical protein [Actinokineospora fastidiosa]|uniref:hypothetical protein n=1 Tax=Actinokineospora fastidiosa TaxID=1816 RepID=UPI00166FC281|nr:hypothetical protein [Actinokineospora fastidiosa]
MKLGLGLADRLRPRPPSVVNQVSGTVHGPVIQAGAIHGDITITGCRCDAGPPPPP